MFHLHCLSMFLSIEVLPAHSSDAEVSAITG
jgi:hypothetical protein